MERFHESGIHLSHLNDVRQDLLDDGSRFRFWQLIRANSDESWLKPRLSDEAYRCFHPHKATAP